MSNRADVDKLVRLLFHSDPKLRLQGRELLETLADPDLYDALAGHLAASDRRPTTQQLELFARAPAGLANVEALIAKAIHLDARGLEALAGVRVARRLEELDLRGIPESEGEVDLDQLAGLDRLSSLHLGSIGFRAGAGLAGLPALRKLRIHGDCRYGDLPVLPHLEQLSIFSANERPVNLGQGLPALRDLQVRTSPRLASLAPLGASSHLTRVVITPAADLTEVDGLGQAVARGAPLIEVQLEGAARLTSLAGLAGAARLEVLELGGLAALTDVSPLADLPALHRLELRGATALTDVAALARLPSLRVLDLRGCTALEDVGALAGLPALRVLALHGTAVEPARVPAAIRFHATWADRPLFHLLAQRPRVELRA